MLLALTGLKRSGKSTAAHYLAQKHNFKIVSFADPLKRACGELFGLDYAQLYGSYKERPSQEHEDRTPREILQFVGTDLLRNQIGRLLPKTGDRIFVLAMERRIQEIRESAKYSRIVIDDLRFPNEAEMIRAYHGYIVNIDRFNESTDEHESEQYANQIKYNYHIENRDSVDELFSNLDYIVANAVTHVRSADGSPIVL